MWFRKKKEKKAEPSPSSDEMVTAECMSFLNADDVARAGGVPGAAIIGVFVDDVYTAPVDHTLRAKSFRQNPAFIDLMHQVIKNHGPDDPGLRKAAADQRDGWVYIIDLRTPEGPQGRIPPEDIIGAFKVERGQLIKDSYWANEKHLAFTANGLVKLPNPFHEALMRELRKLKYESQKA